MTTPSEPARPGVATQRGRRDLVLARVHLRLGQLALARAELEDLCRPDMPSTPSGLADLAEARWRTGDCAGAGEAARAHLEPAAGRRRACHRRRGGGRRRPARRGATRWWTGCAASDDAALDRRAVRRHAAARVLAGAGPRRSNRRRRCSRTCRHRSGPRSACRPSSPAMPRRRRPAVPDRSSAVGRGPLGRPPRRSRRRRRAPASSIAPRSRRPATSAGRDRPPRRWRSHPRVRHSRRPCWTRRRPPVPGLALVRGDAHRRRARGRGAPRRRSARSARRRPAPAGPTLEAEAAFERPTNSPGGTRDRTHPRPRQARRRAAPARRAGSSPGSRSAASRSSG